jgi:hypothetical protein
VKPQQSDNRQGRVLAFSRNVFHIVRCYEVVKRIDLQDARISSCTMEIFPRMNDKTVGPAWIETKMCRLL